MTVLVDEKFETGIPPGFATADGGTVSYDSVAKAAVMDAGLMSGAWAGWKLSGIPATESMSLELDLQLVARYTPARIGVAFHKDAVFNSTAGNDWIAGILESETAVEFGNSGQHPWIPYVSEVEFQQTGFFERSTSRYKWRVDTWLEGGKRVYIFYRDGGYRKRIEDASAQPFARPTLMFHNTKYLIHGVYATDTPDTAAVAPIPSAFVATELMKRGLPVPALAPARAVTPTAMEPGLLRRVAGVLPWGRGRVAGDVMIEADFDNDTVPDIPVRRLVRLFRDLDGRLAGETYSDSATGAFEFLNVSTDYTYTAIAYDDTHSYRAVVADGVAPEPMP